nr:MAG TPA: hypothetical protein [Caudoviricetes sp.]
MTVQRRFIFYGIIYHNFIRFLCTLIICHSTHI